MKKDKVVRVLILAESVKNYRATGVFRIQHFNTEQRKFLEGMAEDILKNWDA